MARRSKRPRYRGGRYILNDPGHHSTAAIVAEVEDTSGWPEGQDHAGNDLKDRGWCPAPDYTFAISDCDRKINIEFDFHDPEDRRNSLLKADRLLAAMQDFNDALHEEVRLYEEREKLTGKSKF